MHVASRPDFKEAVARERDGFRINRHVLLRRKVMRAVFSLCALTILVAACQPPETPLSPPSAGRTDIIPAAWMVGCFAIDRTERLRAEGAPDAIELTGRSADVWEGKQRYRVALNGSDL